MKAPGSEVENELDGNDFADVEASGVAGEADGESDFVSVLRGDLRRAKKREERDGECEGPRLHGCSLRLLGDYYIVKWSWPKDQRITRGNFESKWRIDRYLEGMRSRPTWGSE